LEHNKGPGETLTARGTFLPRRAYNPPPMGPPHLHDLPPCRPVTVVLGAGRSGTSLLMQVLAALGLRVSEQLIEARRDNPRGFFEDAAIVRIQANLLRALGAWPFHPLPNGWLGGTATATAREALKAVLRQRLAGGGPWGFKDPRTAPFLPLWQELFAAENLAPRYLLALRQPGRVLHSYAQAYGTPAQVAEAVWLRRTCDALWHTRADCHIVHYEDWFIRPGETAEALAHHLGLTEPARDVLQALIEPDLDRSGDTHPVMIGGTARRLYTALRTCRGSDFEREGLLAVVAECREVLDRQA